jgi:hypothetical protein
MVWFTYCKSIFNGIFNQVSEAPWKFVSHTARASLMGCVFNRNSISSKKRLLALLGLLAAGATALPWTKHFKFDGTVSDREEGGCTFSGDDAGAPLVRSGSCPTLFRLDLPGKGINSVSAQAFAGLEDLKIVDLSSNMLTSLPDSVFTGLRSLVQLDLRENKLASLSSNIFPTSLESLDLGGNEVASLSDSLFAGLRSLMWLNLRENKLASLPDSLFADLTNLLELRLTNNQLKSLPDSIFTGLFGDDKFLPKLWLSNNQLECAPLFAEQRKQFFTWNGDKIVPIALTYDGPPTLCVPITYVRSPSTGNGTTTMEISQIGVTSALWLDGVHLPEGALIGNGLHQTNGRDITFSVRWSGMLRAPDANQNSFSTASQEVTFITVVGCPTTPYYHDGAYYPRITPPSDAPYCPFQDERVKLWVDNSLVIDQWTSLAGTVATASPPSLNADRIYDIKLEYKNSVSISQTGLTTPLSLIGDGSFSVRWSGMVRAPETSQNYSFSAAVGFDTANSGSFQREFMGLDPDTWPTQGLSQLNGRTERVRLWIDNTLIIDQWTSLRLGGGEEGRVPTGGPVSLIGNQYYHIKVEYKNFVLGGAKLALKWEGPFQPSIVTTRTPPALTPKTTSEVAARTTPPPPPPDTPPPPPSGAVYDAVYGADYNGTMPVKCATNYTREELRSKYQRCGKDRCGGQACTVTEPVFATGGTGNKMPPEDEFEVWVIVCDKRTKECYKFFPSRHDLSVCV